MSESLQNFLIPFFYQVTEGKDFSQIPGFHSHQFYGSSPVEVKPAFAIQMKGLASDIIIMSILGNAGHLTDSHESDIDKGAFHTDQRWL